MFFCRLATYAVPGWLTNEEYLQGLGLTQSLPGPLFNFSAYIGAVYKGVPGALLAWVRSMDWRYA
jgi:chromate transporter